MSKFERILANVPRGTLLPDELRLVCDWLDRVGYPISGSMKIRPDDFGGVRAWFGGDDEVASRFAYFGAGPDGSILALWLINGPDARACPVVHLGSEGSGNKVLAASFREFLPLFGIGYDELGFDDLSEPPDDPEPTGNFRAWLKREFGITCPERGEELVAAAQRRCPDIEAFIRDWFRRRYGEDM